jgi:hypothetical protein
MAHDPTNPSEVLGVEITSNLHCHDRPTDGGITTVSWGDLSEKLGICFGIDHKEHTSFD